MNRWGRAAVSAALIGWLATGGAAQADPGSYVRAAGTEATHFQVGPQAVTEQIGFDYGLAP
ncbi:hypothetical protein ACIHDR_21985 [Nocardia sp. NPDC052278]|uniref:hypothetical protein n=1 Tax=unclassified Nocardia TaxID=2637762 RepID=UPI00368A3B19